MLKTKIKDGLILSPTHLELIVADHCNQSCRSCNHASPAVDKWLADPDSVNQNFSVLAKYYRPKFVKILGGEPLLHPELAKVIQASRSTGISDHFQLSTNGLLLHKMDDAVMGVIDELEISVYPGTARIKEILSLAREKTLQFGKKLTVNEYDVFRATFTAVGTSNEILVNKIYKTCKIAHVWACGAVRDGNFYKCAASIFIPQLVENIPGEDDNRIEINDSEEFQAQLFAFINSPDSMSCCRYCLGTVGKQKPHKMVSRIQWMMDTQKPSEDLIDYDWLERSLIKQDLFDDCKILTELNPKSASSTSWFKRIMGLVLPRKIRKFAPIRLPGPVRQTSEETRREMLGKVSSIQLLEKLRKTSTHEKRDN